MATQGIHGNLLEVTVVSCNKLKDTEWISRQDPYVCVEYGSNRSRTRTCTDGGKNPTFQEKFVYTLIEGLRELNVNVWNSNTVKHDDFIGSGKVQLAKALSNGFDDSTWPLQSKTGRHSGEVRLIIHYNNANKPGNSHAHAPVAQQYGPPQPSLYSAPPQPPPSVSYPPPASAGYPYPQSGYPPAGGGYPAPSPYPSYPPTSGAYPPSSSYPPQPAPYPAAQPYPPNPAYPPQPYGSYYPPGSTYPGQRPPPY